MPTIPSLTANPTDIRSLTLAGYDGTLDFRGTSGMNYQTGPLPVVSECFRLQDPMVVSQFVDTTPLDPSDDFIEFSHNASDFFMQTGGAQVNSIVNTAAALTVEVVYTSCQCIVSANDDTGNRVCAGSSVTIPVLVNDSTTCGAIDPASLMLTPSTGFSQVGPNIVFDSTGLAPGQYSASYTVFNDQLPPCCDQGLVSVTVCAVAAADDTARVCAGASVTIPVLSNDTSSCGPLNAGSLAFVGTPPAGFSIVGGQIVYANPGTPRSGTVQATYQVCNSLALPCCDQATVTVTVCSVDALPDTARVCAGSSVTIPVLANDTTNCGTLSLPDFVGVPPNGFSIVGGQIVYTNSGTPSSGTVQATYRVCNTETIPCCAQSTVTVTVCNVTALPDTARVCAGSAVTIPVLANDSTTCGTLNPASLTFVGTPPAGFSIAGGQVVYTNPGSPSSGTVQATYRVCNTEAIPCCAQSTVTVTVCSVNAVPDTARVCAGSSVNIPVLANDTSTCGPLDPTSLAFVGTPPAGFSMAPGRIVYTNTGSPSSGTFQVTYRVCNTESPACCAQATVTVTVCSVTATPDTARVCAGSSVTIPVLANDTTSCGTLNAGSLAFVGTPPSGFSIAGGQIVYSNSGTPGSGTVQATYQVCNTETIPCCAQSTVTVTICSVTALPDTANVCAGSSVTIPVLANDTTNCGTLNPATLAFVGTPPTGFAIVGGQVVYTNSGTPGSGNVQATYQVCNTESPACCAQSTVTVSVCSVAALPDTARVCAGSSVTIPVLANDTASCGALNPASLAFVGTPPAGFSIAGGQVVYTNSGSPTSGTVQATYRICDSAAIPCCAQTTVTVTVCSVAALPDTARVCAGSTVTIPVLSNDSTSCGTLNGASLAFVGTPPSGFSIAGGQIVYANPGTPSSGTVQATYQVCNTEAIPCCGQATVTVTICSVTALPDTASVCVGSSVTIPVLANDATNCGTLSAASLTFVGTPPSGFAIVGGQIVYTNPGSPSSGTVQATYRVCNTEAIPCCAQSTVTVTICSIAAVPDTARVCAGSSVTIPVLANDSTTCAALDTASLAFVGTPPSGFAIVAGQVVYTNSGTPASGTVQATYRICNAGAIPCCAQTTVTVTVCSVNALPDTARVCAGSTVTIPVLANDTTSCGTLNAGSLAFVGTPPTGFSIVGGQVVYANSGTPATGTVQATYRVCNNEAIPCCGQSTVTVTVCSVVALPNTVRVCAGSSITIPVLANDTTSCGTLDAGSLSFVGRPPAGFSILGGQIIYKSPSTPGTGTVQATYQVCNTESPPCCAQSTVTVMICSATAGADSAQSCTGGSVTIPVLANDSTTCGFLVPSTLQFVGLPPVGFSISGTNIVYNSTLGPPSGTFVATYQVCNDQIPACCAQGTVTVTVCLVNAENELLDICCGETESVDVLANDTSTCGALLVELIAPVPPGFSLLGSVVTYNSTLGPCPPQVSVAYRISGAGPLACTDQALVNVTIRNLPTAVDDILALGNLSGPVTIPVLDNDLPGAGCSFLACTGCPGGQPCGVRIITPPLHGTAVVNPDCTVTYTPGASFGTDEQFCYELTNSCGCTDQACVQLTGCREVNRRTCASLLLYPEFDNRQSALTLYTIDNACCDLTTGTVLVEFRFIDKATCLETNRTFSLTPCDTISFLTSTVNPNSVEGYAYAYAKRSTAGPGNPNGEPIVFNHLIGQLLVIDGIEALDYSLNAVSFLGIGRKYEANDDDHDGIRDLNGPSSPLAEYEEAPDQILIPRFLGQDPAGPGALYNSSVILIALSGGSQFTTSIAVLGFNDSETVFSSAYSFRCWDKAPLRELAPFSLESFLDGVSNDPAEIVGAPAKESGWLLIDGDVAFSTAEEIVDPAVYAVLVERIGPLSVADLPFELCSQTNGDLLPNGPFGDGPNPVVGDNQ